jgi:hypothetical protein
MLTRALLTSAILLTTLAVAGAFILRRRQTASKKAQSLLGRKLPVALAGGVRYLLFTSKYCVPCRQLKEALDAAQVSWKELALEDSRPWFEALGLRSTPFLIEIDARRSVVAVWDAYQTREALEHLANQAQRPTPREDGERLPDVQYRPPEQATETPASQQAQLLRKSGR